MGNEEPKNKTEKLDIKTLENWLWEAACAIRGPVDAPKYKDFILPLIFLKRLCDVYEYEFNKLVEYYGSKEFVEEMLEAQRKYGNDGNTGSSLVQIRIPKNAHWSDIMNEPTKIGEFLTSAVSNIAKDNPKLAGVIDITDFNQTAGGQRVLSDDNLRALIQILNKHSLGIADADPDIIGQAYEYMLRKFAEGSGQSAGEFYTPKEVAQLMANIMDPLPGNTIYDPCLGSGGLLIKCFLVFQKKYDDDPNFRPLKFFGQEILHNTYAMAKMNLFIHNLDGEIYLGNTMENPANKKDDSTVKKFDIVLANPMWNQDNIDIKIYDNDNFNRFEFGYPPKAALIVVGCNICLQV
jgi:type I restriction enzyme M protein